MIEIGDYTDLMYLTMMDGNDREHLDSIWQQLYAQMMGWC